MGVTAIDELPQQVRCRKCGELAQEERRERQGDEVQALYVCPKCFQWQVRRHFEAQWRR